MPASQKQQKAAEKSSKAAESSSSKKQIGEKRSHDGTEGGKGEKQQKINMWMDQEIAEILDWEQYINNLKVEFEAYL